jgi:hypothetical protein
MLVTQCATCPAHYILLDMIILIIYGQGMKSLIMQFSLSCHFIQLEQIWNLPTVCSHKSEGPLQG